MTIESFEKLNLPDTPGVYFWKRNKTILYIGKATSLRDRIRSYFSNDLLNTRGPRLVDMVFKSDSIKWQETGSVLEAVIAEANLIKKHWPDYNIRDKDDKSFNYVVITREDFPKLIIIRGRNLDIEKKQKKIKIKKIFGPFPNSASLREALKIVRKMFPYLDDKPHRFYRQIGLAPDISSLDAKAEYQKTIKHIILFFGGKKKTLIRELETEMLEYAHKKQFERAGEIKKKIFALNHIRDVALIKEDTKNFTNFRIEAYDVAHMSGKESVGVMVVISDGEIAKSEYRKFKLSPNIGNNDTASLREILERRFNHPEWSKPDLVVIDGEQNQINVAKKTLKEKGINVHIVSVVKDDHHKPCDFLGDMDLINKHKKAILLANSESHRFAITYHRKLRKIF